MSSSTDSGSPSRWKTATGRALVLALASLLLAAPAWANPGQPAVAGRGHDEYSRGEFTAALASFRSDYEVTGVPELLFHIAECHRRLGDFRAALDHYRMFLNSPSDEVELREQADRHVEMLERAVGVRDVMAAEEGVADRRGTEQRRELTSPPERSSQRDDRSGYRTAFWISAGTTVSLLTVTTLSAIHVQGTLTDRKNSEWDALVRSNAEVAGSIQGVNACATAIDLESSGGVGADQVADYAAACRNGRRWETITNGLYLATLSGALVTGYLGYRAFRSGGEPKDSAARSGNWRAGVGASADGASATLTYDF